MTTLATEQLSEVTGAPKFTLVAVHPVFVATVNAAGAVMVGLTLSTTVTVCVAVAVLPAASVTVQVTVVFPIGKVAGALLTTLATEQLSAVIGVPSDTPVAVQEAFAFTVTAAGATIVGATCSKTVTVKEQVADVFWAALMV